MVCRKILFVIRKAEGVGTREGRSAEVGGEGVPVLLPCLHGHTVDREGWHGGISGNGNALQRGEAELPVVIQEFRPVLVEAERLLVLSPVLPEFDVHHR